MIESSLQIKKQTVEANSGSKSFSVKFEKEVSQIGACLSGFAMSFGRNDDHHVKNIGVQIDRAEIASDNKTVDIEITVTLSDDGRAGLDTATVDVVVFADSASSTT